MGKYLVHIVVGDDIEIRGYSSSKPREGERVKFNILKYKIFSG